MKLELPLRQRRRPANCGHSGRRNGWTKADIPAAPTAPVLPIQI